MSVISSIVAIEKVENFDNCYVENELKKMNIDPIRWAIVEVLENKLKVSVSYF